MRSITSSLDRLKEPPLLFTEQDRLIGTLNAIDSFSGKTEKLKRLLRVNLGAKEAPKGKDSSSPLKASSE